MEFLLKSFVFATGPDDTRTGEHLYLQHNHYWQMLQFSAVNISSLKNCCQG